MSANIDTMMYVKEVPWHGLGHRYEEAPSTPQEIITAAQLDWTVGTEKMVTSLHGDIPFYHAVYREDNNEVLGVVNKAIPRVVQNVETFNAFEDLIAHDVTVDTAASLGRGETVFGCFSINNEFDVLDDKIKHYFVVVNDHLRPDGKVTVMHTPVRVVCQNTLSAALNSAQVKARIPVVADTIMNSELARKLISDAEASIQLLSAKAEKMATQKISRTYIETLLDELFPYLQSKGDEALHTAANEKISVVRDTFIEECMGADNLANYRGTQYQVFNALTDFSQHYFKDATKAYDLKYRMGLLPGMGASESPSSLVTKYMRIKDKIAA